MRLWRHQIELSTFFLGGEQHSNDWETKSQEGGFVRRPQNLAGDQGAASMTSAAFSAII